MPLGCGRAWHGRYAADRGPPSGPRTDGRPWFPAATAHTPSARLSTTSSAAPTTAPTVAERHVVGVKAGGTSSLATSQIIAPAANANETASSAETSSTRKYAMSAPTGWGRLVVTAVQNWRARLAPAASIGIAFVVPSGTFWSAMARITNRPSPAVADA